MIQNNKSLNFFLFCWTSLIVFGKISGYNNKFSEIFLLWDFKKWGAKGVAKVLEHRTTKKSALSTEKAVSLRGACQPAAQ